MLPFYKWGRPPGLQAGPLAGHFVLTAAPRQRDQGVPRRPGGPPHLLLLALLGGVRLFAEPADLVWSARYVVTMDAQHRLIENGAVAIRGERIVGVGSRA